MTGVAATWNYLAAAVAAAFDRIAVAAAFDRTAVAVAEAEAVQLNRNRDFIILDRL
jgi:hypothetical protein